MADLIIPNEFAEIKEIGKEKQENCVRVYCCSYPNVFKFQIRTYKPTKDEGVKRQMMASVSLTIDEVRNILKYMEEQK